MMISRDNCEDVITRDKQSRRNSLQVIAPQPLITAVKTAAGRDLMTSSEYVRRAIIHQLRADGIDVNASAQSSAAAA